ncbi:FmdB family zinc ribbon protein [Legionella spiritensis]|nr:hypothetical protein [Legionella spiritensis]
MMPVYVYETIENEEQCFEFLQNVNDPPLSIHPDTGIKIRRIVVPGVAVKTRGLPKGMKVNKSSPAATACGCSSKVQKSMGHRSCGH